VTRRFTSLFAILALLPVWTAAQEAGLSGMSDAAFISHVRTLRQGDTGAERTQSLRARRGCLFDVSLEIARRMTVMNYSDRAELKRILTPVSLQTTIYSPSGRFRVSFDTVGSNTPAMLDAGGMRIPGTALQYATALAAAFDTVYDAEVTRAGYPPPPFEDAEMVYNIRIREMGSDYGWTIPISLLPSNTVQPCSTTYIEIDNDFAGNYYTRGLNGARVTAAHEFHHMIQLGVYGAWYSDQWFHELTSTFFEDYVFDEVNDYYQYLEVEQDNKSVFNFPERPMYAWMEWGYPLVIFAKFLEKRFPDAALRRTWEEMKRQEPVSALDDALRASAVPSDLSAEICMYARWNHATGPRYSAMADTANRYDEGADYPSVRFAATTEAIGGSATFNSAVAPLGSVYLRSWSGVDTIAFSVTNTDIPAARDRSISAAGFRLDVKKGDAPPDFNSAGNGWHYRLSTASSGILCLNVFSIDAIPDLKVTAYPNPFDPAEDHLRLAVPHDIKQTRGTLAIFSGAMDLVMREENAAVRADPIYGRHILWDGRTKTGDLVGSGVYIYYVLIGGRTLSGKFAVVRR